MPAQTKVDRLQENIQIRYILLVSVLDLKYVFKNKGTETFNKQRAQADG